ncbi:MAG: cation:proton antiporter [Candidatus Aegiribacteria sp. MLS_C]|nr:MAG: cation:proton antiporter [Candidatus Aegiribacteria sp. MLS_C]
MTFLNEYAFYIGAFGLILIGLLTILLRHHLIKLIIGLSIMETGINLFLIAIGYISRGTAPIFPVDGGAGTVMVDPVPQALVLTAIVIGVAVLAMALGMAIRLHGHYGTLDMRRIKELKW